MDSHDYQQFAREAEDKAWATTSDDLRARWLDIAQMWLLLASDAGQREVASHTVTSSGRKHPPSVQ